MLARIQQFITLGLLSLAALWAAWFVHTDRPVWAFAGAALIVFGYVLFLGLEFILVWCVHGDDPAAPKASAAQLLKAWLHEAITAPRIFCWQQPFRSEQIPDLLPAGSSGQRGVVLVHGFVCNRGFWNRWMRMLHAQRIPFVAVNLEPVLGSISGYTPIIESAVQRIEQATGLTPVLVGHSMGGLAIRAWMASHRAGDRIHRVVTIGSPHRGTWLGRFGLSRNTREMALGTSWQQALQSEESTEGYFRRFICFYSHCDNIVFPASVATLPGADNRHVPGIAHVQLADQPLIFEAVVAALSSKA